MDERNTAEGSIGLSALVRAALEGDAREGITNLLEEIASVTKSFGCVLWRATEGAVPPNKGELTMLAAWFSAEKSHFGIRNAPFKKSVAGTAATNERGWELDNDLEANKNLNCDKPFFKKNELNRVVACRFEYLPRKNEDPRVGVVMIFRRKRDSGYEESDALRLRQISDVLPYLYSGARQKASFGLLKEVAEILREARRSSKPGHPTSKVNRNKILRGIASAVAGTFHSIETTIFLEDERHPGTFTCAYTSKGPCAATVRKDSYEPTVERGFSALCLLTREPIRVHDLLNPQPEVEELRQKHPGFKGPQRAELAELVLKDLGNPEPPPPLSMMVAPLAADGEALGFLRCWVAKSGPSYFSSDDRDLLRLVADYLSQTVAVWKQDLRTVESRKREHQAFTKFAQSAQVVGKGREDQELPLAALGLVRQLLPEAVFNTIRLRSASPDQLSYSYYGYAKDSQYGVESEEQLVKRMRAHPQPLPGLSLAAVAVENRKLKLVRGGTQLAKHASDVAAEAGEMIIAPIEVADRVEAVLDLRTKKGVKFSPQATAVAGSISTLLALQMARGRAEKERLAAEKQKFETRSRADRELAENERALRDAFEDVSHQIKSPLGEAARRVENAVGRFQQGAVAQELEAISTLLRRAELTAKLIGLFANLARGKQLAVTGTAHTPVDLVRMAGQICENQRPRISERRNIRIELDPDSFYRHAPSDLSVDSELLPQALNNLVDNAVKYSYPNTVIRVAGASLKRGGFMIAVTNRGIPIKPSEVHLVRQRNWRGELAKASSGEGNGLGLWIVDHIMKAHGGELQVLPTRPIDGITELRLAFPFAT